METYQFRLHAYVLMDNHFHLLVGSPLGNVSQAMRQFNVAYTGYYNRRHQRSGHLYQGRFKAIVVEADAYLLARSRYIHLNPIRVERVRSKATEEQMQGLRQYGWSSLCGDLRARDREPWITYDRVLAYTGGDTSSGRVAYARFVEEGVRQGVAKPWDKVAGGVLLGSEAFVASVQRRCRMTRDRERPAVRTVAQGRTPWSHQEADRSLVVWRGTREHDPWPRAADGVLVPLWSDDAIGYWKASWRSRVQPCESVAAGFSGGGGVRPTRSRSVYAGTGTDR